MPDDGAPERGGSRTERFRRVMELFESVVGLSTEEREARLASLGPGEAELRREVEAMLAADARTSTPMTVGGGIAALARVTTGGGVEGLESEDDEDGGAPLPVLAGQYRIVRRIGEGGMGVVYEAEQALPRRNVALKALRPGYASRRVLRRFEHEAHILGRLHHPGIAQIYEAGLSDSERGDQAFIAMELVDGTPLGEWARDRSAREKAELVARVCDAVQHAHQRRVIHRDLKPANLLVDRAGHPRVLDFGVARLADTDADEGDTLRTREGQIVGTLPYMSPEQVSGDPDEVDARTDVYALGVILYELLSGRLPHSPKGRSLTEMAIAIRDEEPPRLGRLDAALRGDLESIAAKALQKDRERRYQSALELADDLRRWLAGAPVRARGESLFYVLGRQIRRHRWIALSSALAISGLVAFALLARIGERRAARYAGELSAALRTSQIELGRAMARSDNLTVAERLIWDAYLERPDEHARWALWDVYSQFPCLRSFSGHTDSVVVMSASPDAGRLVTGSHDQSVRVWDVSSGSCLSVRRFDGQIVRAAFRSDGRAVCGGDFSGALAAWDPRTGEELWRADPAPVAPLVDLAVAESRPVAGCVGEGAECALVDLDAGAVTSRLAAEGAHFRSVALDPTAALVALGDDDGTLRLFDAAQGAERWHVSEHASAVSSVRFLPPTEAIGGARLVSGDDDGLVLVHAIEDGRVTGRFAGGMGSVRSIEYSADRARVLLSCSGGIGIWDAADDVPRDERPRFRQVGYAAMFLPDRDELVTGSIGGGIRVWELEPNRCLSTLPVRTPQRARCWLGPRAEILGRDAGGGRVELVDLSGRVVASVDSGMPEIYQIGFDALGTRMAVASRQRRLVVWSLPGPARLFELELESDLTAFRFAPDGAAIVTLLADGSSRVIDATSGAERAKLVHLAGPPQRLAFSADARRLATTHRGGRIELWDLARGALERTLESPRAVLSVGFESPGRERLYAGTWDGCVLLFDCATGELVRTLEGHAQLVPWIASSADGRFVVSGGSDGQVRLWNRDVEVCLLTLDAHAGGVVGLGFGGEDSRLRVIYGDGSVREWDLGYFDRHIAGNEAFQRALRSPVVPESP